MHKIFLVVAGLIYASLGQRVRSLERTSRGPCVGCHKLLRRDNAERGFSDINRLNQQLGGQGSLVALRGLAKLLLATPMLAAYHPAAMSAGGNPSVNPMVVDMPNAISKLPRAVPVLRAPVPLMEAVVTPEDERPLLVRAKFGLALAILFYLILYINRFTLTGPWEELANSQSRAELVAGFAVAGIATNAINDWDITPEEAEPVPPKGVSVDFIEPQLPPEVTKEFKWVADTIMSDGVTTSLGLWLDGRTLMLRGIVSEEAAQNPAKAVQPGEELWKASQSRLGLPQYKSALQQLVCSVEFPYFPDNAEGVLLLPFKGASRGALILACDRKRAYAENDVEWYRSLCQRSLEVLQANLPQR